MNAPSPIDAELAAVRGEQGRLDAKCGTLTAVAGAVMAILTSQIGRTALPVRILLALASLALAASAVVLLAGVLRPRLGTTGFMRYAAMTPEEITGVFDRWSPQQTINDLRFLSSLVLTKQRRLRLAIDLLIMGLVLIGIALGAAVIA